MNGFHYSLGLDIGIASVGWAILKNDSHGEPMKIERLGVRIYDKAEVPKTGDSLAAGRRAARGSRRTTRRRRHRKERIRQLILQNGLLSKEELAALFESSSYPCSVYELRVYALSRILTKEEAVRLMLHFAQRRGFKSNSRAQEQQDEKENGKVKQVISANEACMKANNYRTVGEMLWLDERFRIQQPDGSIVHVVHNKAENYKVTVSRKMMEDEIGLIFRTQRELGAEWANADLEREYLSIWGSQRNFDEGPGGKSPYSGNQIENMLGKCTFEEGELRAPKGSYTAEKFRLLQSANHLKVVGHGNPADFLNEDQRQAMIALAMKSPTATYAQLRKAIHLPDDMFFNSLLYGNKTTEEVEKKTKLNGMKFYHEMRKALDKVEKNAIQKLSAEQLDEIARILLVFKSDDNRRTAFAESEIPEIYWDALMPLSTAKPANLSLKAMRKLMPYLEQQGMTYAEACKAVYGDHYGRKGKGDKTSRLSLSDIDENTNPVVRRAVSQTIKVINAIVREYGAPEVVRVELAREMGKPFEERNRIEKRQKENAEKNDAIRELVEEYKHDHATGLDIVKYKLFKEQNGVCLYSGENLDIARLFEPGYVDVDHIIPYSISFDDSYQNKVLVRASENRQKGNRIPYEYFGSDAKRWDAFKTLVGTQVGNFKKRKNLLCQSLSDAQIDGFHRRNLVDTQYLSRAVYRLLDDHLAFDETGNYKRKTHSVNGAITAQMRGRWGIDKVRADGDLHHAKDAAVIACVSPGMIQKITLYSKQRECIHPTSQGYVDMETGEIMTRAEYDAKYAPRFPMPWERFREELEARLSPNPRGEIDLLKLESYEPDEPLVPVFVSRKPNHKVTGAAHMETIRSGKKEGCTVTKTALENLKLDKEGEIAGFYNRASDTLLYDALKKRLTAYKGDGKKAFAEPFYKPKHDGTPGPQVKKVKIAEKASLTVPVCGGIAGNGSMVRVDVFKVPDDGYYFVPIYVSDTVKKELPNRAVVAHKPYDQWKQMQEEHFVFSLYAGDLIYIENNKSLKLKRTNGPKDEKELPDRQGMFYYVCFNISTGAFDISTHDRKFQRLGLGGKTLTRIEKYEVNVLGSYHPVRLPEKRKGFEA